MILTDETRINLRGKKAPLLLCPVQISHGLNCDRTQASAVKGRGLGHCTAYLKHKQNREYFFLSYDPLFP